MLLCLGSVWFSFNLVHKYNQIKQFRSANNLLTQKKYQEAIAAVDGLLKAEAKGRDLLWINRGYALSNLNQYQEMLESCANATMVNPRSGLGWNCKGEALYYLDQYQGALVAFNQALKANPQEVIFWLNKSRVLSDLQQYEQANSAGEQAIQLGTKFSAKNQTNRQNLAIAHRQGGENLLKTKQYKLAIKAFESSLVYAPDNLATKHGQGVALYELKHYQEAKEIFTQNLERAYLTPKQQSINLLYQGISLCKMQDLEEAQKTFAKVLKLTTEPTSQKIAKAGCGIR